MEIVINEEKIDWELHLRYTNALLEDGIDISKFLREDLSIDLELLEVAISLIINTRKDFHIYGLGDYYKNRKIENDWNKKREEALFIANHIESIVQEFSETGEKEIYFNG